MDDISATIKPQTRTHRPHSAPTRVRRVIGQWHESDSIQDRYWSADLLRGLRLVFIPRAGFASKAAMLTFKVGSINTAWKDSGGKVIKVPAGSAHFLEHQLFKKASGDLSARFDQTGASTNAYTTQYSTSFHFEGVSHFNENLDTLLELGLKPYFDAKLVETERGIIEQELARYDDRADTKAWNSLMHCLYHRHPVREDIIGTMESLSRISPKSLATIHGAYYHPSNACLFVSGDLDPEQVAAAANDSLSKHFDGRAFQKPKRIEWEEPKRVRDARAESSFHSTHSWLMLGWKMQASGLKGLQGLREDEAASAALTLAFGAGTDFLERVVRDGLTLDNLGSGYLSMEDCAYAMIGGETPDPERLEAAIQNRIDEVNRGGFDPAELELHKRKSYGVSLRKAESPENAVAMHDEAWLAEVDPFAAPKVVLSLKPKDLMTMWHRMTPKQGEAVVVIRPAAKTRSRRRSQE